MLESIFPRDLLKQEVCGGRFMHTLEEVLDAGLKEGISNCCADGMKPVLIKIERIE